MCDAKSYLRKIEQLDAHIDGLVQDLQNEKVKAEKVTATISPVVVAHSGNQANLEITILKIIELQEEINRKIDRFISLKREIRNILEQLEDPNHVKVLHKRYFEYKPWEQIAIEMKYSYRNVCNIHGYALQAFEAVMEGGKKNTVCEVPSHDWDLPAVPICSGFLFSD